MIKYLCEEATNQASNSTASIFVYVLLFAVLILMIVLPMIKGRKQNQEYMTMLDSLKVGDLIETKGGIIGKITKLIDKGDIKTMIIETGVKGEKSFMEMDIASVGTVLKSTKVQKTDEKSTEETENQTDDEAKDIEEAKDNNAGKEKTEEKKSPAKKQTKKSSKK